MKDDVNDDYSQWLHEDDINFSLQWLLHDYESPLGDCVEVIRSNFWGKVEKLYNEMMNKTGLINPFWHTFDIHFFLMKKKLMLEKRFIFFVNPLSPELLEREFGKSKTTNVKNTKNYEDSLWKF